MNIELRTRLINFIETEGVNQKHICLQVKINQALLSRFKNKKYELNMIEAESLGIRLVKCIWHNYK